MALHISGKLCALGLVLAALITAFGAPKGSEPGTDVAVAPSARVLAEARAVAPRPPMGPVANPVWRLRATGYNSYVSQTDASPDITATGTRTRFGVIAVSRDLLGAQLPYGSLVRLRDLGNYRNGRGAGRFQSVLDGQLFIVEDTMNARKRQQIDVWFPDMANALSWGVRAVEVELVRYGYTGPELYAQAPPDLAFDAAPKLASAD